MKILDKFFNYDLQTILIGFGVFVFAWVVIFSAIGHDVVWSVPDDSGPNPNLKIPNL